MAPQTPAPSPPPASGYSARSNRAVPAAANRAAVGYTGSETVSGGSSSGLSAGAAQAARTSDGGGAGLQSSHESSGCGRGAGSASSNTGHPSYLEDHVARMQAEIERTTRRLEMEKRRLHELGESSRKAQHEFQDKRLRYSFNKAGAQAERLKAENNVLLLENRLSQALCKLNSGNDDVNKLKALIDKHRKDRLAMEKVYRHVHRELAHHTDHLTHAKEKTAQLQEWEHQSTRRMDELNKAKEHEREAFKQHCLAMQKELREQDRQIKEFDIRTHRESSMQRTQMKGSPYSLAEEEHTFNPESLMKLIFKTALLNAAHRHNIKQYRNKISVFEKAMESIKTSTGISDAEEIVSIFSQLEERNYSVMTYVNNINVDLESLETKKRQLELHMQQQAHHDATAQRLTDEKLRDVASQISNTVLATEGKNALIQRQLQGLQQSHEMLEATANLIRLYWKGPHTSEEPPPREPGPFGADEQRRDLLPTLWFIQKFFETHKDLLYQAKDDSYITAAIAAAHDWAAAYASAASAAQAAGSGLYATSGAAGVHLSSIRHTTLAAPYTSHMGGHPVASRHGENGSMSGTINQGGAPVSGSVYMRGLTSPLGFAALPAGGAGGGSPGGRSTVNITGSSTGGNNTCSGGNVNLRKSVCLTPGYRGSSRLHTAATTDLRPASTEVQTHTRRLMNHIMGKLINGRRSPAQQEQRPLSAVTSAASAAVAASDDVATGACDTGAIQPCATVDSCAETSAEASAGTEPARGDKPNSGRLRGGSVSLKQGMRTKAPAESRKTPSEAEEDEEREEDSSDEKSIIPGDVVPLSSEELRERTIHLFNRMRKKKAAAEGNTQPLTLYLPEKRCLLASPVARDGLGTLSPLLDMSNAPVPGSLSAAALAAYAPSQHEPSTERAGVALRPTPGERAAEAGEQDEGAAGRGVETGKVSCSSDLRAVGEEDIAQNNKASCTTGNCSVGHTVEEQQRAYAGRRKADSAGSGGSTGTAEDNSQQGRRSGTLSTVKRRDSDAGTEKKMLFSRFFRQPGRVLLGRQKERQYSKIEPTRSSASKKAPEVGQAPSKRPSLPLQLPQQQQQQQHSPHQQQSIRHTSDMEKKALTFSSGESSLWGRRRIAKQAADRSSIKQTGRCTDEPQGQQTHQQQQSERLRHTSSIGAFRASTGGRRKSSSTQESKEAKVQQQQQQLTSSLEARQKSSGQREQEITERERRESQTQQESCRTEEQSLKDEEKRTSQQQEHQEQQHQKHEERKGSPESAERMKEDAPCKDLTPADVSYMQGQTEANEMGREQQRAKMLGEGGQQKQGDGQQEVTNCSEQQLLSASIEQSSHSEELKQQPPVEELYKEVPSSLSVVLRQVPAKNAEYEDGHEAIAQQQTSSQVRPSSGQVRFTGFPEPSHEGTTALHAADPVEQALPTTWQERSDARATQEETIVAVPARPDLGATEALQGTKSNKGEEEGEESSAACLSSRNGESSGSNNDCTSKAGASGNSTDRNPGAVHNIPFDLGKRQSATVLAALWERCESLAAEEAAAGRQQHQREQRNGETRETSSCSKTTPQENPSQQPSAQTKERRERKELGLHTETAAASEAARENLLDVMKKVLVQIDSLEGAQVLREQAENPQEEQAQQIRTNSAESSSTSFFASSPFSFLPERSAWKLGDATVSSSSSAGAAARASPSIPRAASPAERPASEKRFVGTPQTAAGAGEMVEVAVGEETGGKTSRLQQEGQQHQQQVEDQSQHAASEPFNPPTDSSHFEASTHAPPQPSSSPTGESATPNAPSAAVTAAVLFPRSHQMSGTSSPGTPQRAGSPARHRSPLPSTLAAAAFQAIRTSTLSSSTVGADAGSVVVPNWRPASAAGGVETRGSGAVVSTAPRVNSAGPKISGDSALTLGGATYPNSASAVDSESSGLAAQVACQVPPVGDMSGESQHEACSDVSRRSAGAAITKPAAVAGSVDKVMAAACAPLSTAPLHATPPSALEASFPSNLARLNRDGTATATAEKYSSSTSARDTVAAGRGDSMQQQQQAIWDNLGGGTQKHATEDGTSFQDSPCFSHLPETLMQQLQATEPGRCSNPLTNHLVEGTSALGASHSGNGKIMPAAPPTGKEEAARPSSASNEEASGNPAQFLSSNLSPSSSIAGTRPQSRGGLAGAGAGAGPMPRERVAAAAAALAASSGSSVGRPASACPTGALSPAVAALYGKNMSCAGGAGISGAVSPATLAVLRQRSEMPSSDVFSPILAAAAALNGTVLPNGLGASTEGPATPSAAAAASGGEQSQSPSYRSPSSPAAIRAAIAAGSVLASRPSSPVSASPGSGPRSTQLTAWKPASPVSVNMQMNTEEVDRQQQQQMQQQTPASAAVPYASAAPHVADTGERSQPDEGFNGPQHMDGGEVAASGATVELGAADDKDEKERDGPPDSSSAAIEQAHGVSGPVESIIVPSSTEAGIAASSSSAAAAAEAADSTSGQTSAFPSQQGAMTEERVEAPSVFVQGLLQTSAESHREEPQLHQASAETSPGISHGDNLVGELPPQSRENEVRLQQETEQAQRDSEGAEGEDSKGIKREDDAERSASEGGTTNSIVLSQHPQDAVAASALQHSSGPAAEQQNGVPKDGVHRHNEAEVRDHGGAAEDSGYAVQDAELRSTPQNVRDNESAAAATVAQLLPTNTASLFNGNSVMNPATPRNQASAEAGTCEQRKSVTSDARPAPLAVGPSSSAEGTNVIGPSPADSVAPRPSTASPATVGSLALPLQSEEHRRPASVGSKHVSINLRDEGDQKDEEEQQHWDQQQHPYWQHPQQYPYGQQRRSRQSQNTRRSHMSLLSSNRRSMRLSNAEQFQFSPPDLQPPEDSPPGTPPSSSSSRPQTATNPAAQEDPVEEEAFSAVVEGSRFVARVSRVERLTPQQLAEINDEE